MRRIRISSINVLNRKDDYGHRISTLMKAISTTIRPDIICMQEIRNDSLDLLSETLDDLGYRFECRHDIMNNPVDTVGIACNPRIMRIDGIHEEPSVESLEVMFSIYGVDCEIISYHGTWGAFNQSARLREVSALSLRRYDSDGIRVIGGDFNAVKEERCIQYMMGNEPGVTMEDWTYWMDARTAMCDIHGTRPVPTTISHGCGSMTAGEHGLDPALLPEREIDNIMSYGFHYGGAGGFTSFRVMDSLDGVNVSTLTDHRVVLADMILPLGKKESIMPLPTRQGNPFLDGNMGGMPRINAQEDKMPKFEDPSQDDEVMDIMSDKSDDE